jgi:hypothetical protein
MFHNNDILIELLENQKKNLSYDKKLSYNDLKRISKYISSSIFNSDCCLWNGYISNSKNMYINFYFNKKKHALHRLLYINYIDDLAEFEYIKYTCNNKGICCNINHMYKVNDNILQPIKKIYINDKINNNIIVNFD